ncbi:MAG: hypothetical protein ACI9ZT_001011 [Gammaproteobacteria bacterium]
MIARNLVMLATDLTPPLKHQFTRNAMGFWGRQPSLFSKMGLRSKLSKSSKSFLQSL